MNIDLTYIPYLTQLTLYILLCPQMQGIFDLLSDGESPLDDDSTDSNADSGHGTSETGNDVSAQKINLSAEGAAVSSSAVVNNKGVLTPVHVYLQEMTPVTSSASSQQRLPRGGDHVSTFGAHLNRHAHAPQQQTDNNHVSQQTQYQQQRHKPQQHVTFDLSNQSPSHKQYQQNPAHHHQGSGTSSHIPQQSSAFQRTHPSGPMNTHSPRTINPLQHHPVNNPQVLRPAGPDSGAPYMDMTGGAASRRLPSHLAVTSTPQSEVSESCDNLSVASTTSGEYFVQLDNGGPIKSVEV